jgi:CBS domain-containing protein
MTRDMVVATRETTLQEVAAMMRDEDTGIIPVVEQTGATFDNAESQNVKAVAAGGSSSGSTTQNTNNNAQGGELRSELAGGRQQQPRANGKLVGLITDRDVVIRAIAAGKDPRTTRAEEIMTDDVYTAQPNDRVIDVIRTMGDKQVRRIPVVDNEGGLRGIISMADVALETEEDRELGNALEEISSGSSFWSKIFG